MTEPLDRELADAERWVDEAATALGRGGPGPAQGALRAVLKAFRNSLPMGEAARFGNLLPALVRGVYYEGASEPVPATREAFLDRVAKDLTGTGILDPESAIAAVIQALRRLLNSKWERLTASWPEYLLDFRGRRTAVVTDDDSPRVQAAADRAALDGGPPVEMQESPATPAADERVRRAGDGSGFIESLQHLNVWLKILADRTSWPDAGRAFSELRTSLRLIRDRLPRADALVLGTRLPAAVRGFYFEDWNPDRPLSKTTFEPHEAVVRLLVEEVKWKQPAIRSRLRTPRRGVRR